MKTKEIRDRIAWVPAWALSLFAAILAAFILSLLRNYVEVPLTYVIWSLMLATASFLICIVHPTKVWLVPILCNILVILPAACDNSFWTTSFGIIIGSGVVLSFFAAQLGALPGRHRINKDNNRSF
ncbi:MAG: hypothetical protein K0B05_11140 [Bacteroidales bacterium]|nr:hypothetical protein [Bacteroidales bacterium]